MLPIVIIIAIAVAAAAIILILRSRASRNGSEQSSPARPRPDRSSTTTSTRRPDALAPFAGDGAIEDWRSELEKPGLTPQRFTMLYALGVREIDPDASVEITGPLQTKVKGSNGNELTSNLDNLWAECADTPGRRGEVLARSFNAMKTALMDDDELAEQDIATRIIPVVRDLEWIEAVEGQARERGLKGSGLVYEPLTDSLMVIYAIDFPDAMRYLQADEIPEEIERKDLRQTALMNLMRIVEPIGLAFTEIAGYVQAGGTYESSLLLLDGLWDQQQQELGGEVVATVPARHILAFCSSSSEKGIAALRELAAESVSHGSRGVSSDLFVWREGAWKKFESI